MRTRPYALPTVIVLTIAMSLTGVAGAAPQPGGHEGGDPQGTGVWPGVGPQVPGVELLVPLDLSEPDNELMRLIADSEGHILVQGRDTGDDSPPDQLLALEATDGSTAWTAEGIDHTCTAVTTDDGRIFAQTEPESTLASADIVEIDAGTGQVTETYTPAGDDADPGFGTCLDSLRLGVDDTLLVLHSYSFDHELVGMTTDGGLAVAWRYDLPDRSGGRDTAQLTHRPVVSPDGSTVYVGHPVDEDDPIRLAVTAIDVASGNAIATAAVPGTQFGPPGTMLHTGDALIVSTRATAGADDPFRLISLDPSSLATRWVVEEADTTADGFVSFESVVLAGDHVVVHDDGRLHGLDPADGSATWTYQATSFSNNGGQVAVDADGNLYLSTFMGATLESVTSEGERRFVTGEGEEFVGDGVHGEMITLGPVIDGRLYGVFEEDTPAARPVFTAIGSGQERLEGIGGDPISIAIQICRYLFGDGTARTVVLSRDDVFADTLAGAPLAGDHSCILFTEGGPDEPINPDVLAEIERALPAGGTVRIAGGVNAVSAQVESTLEGAGFDAQRLAGPGRIETAAEIARVVAAENPSAEAAAVLAYANNWPDAVTAGAAAAARGIPVVLTGTDVLAAPTADVLAELGVTRTYVAGGTAVISDQTAQSAPGAVRVAGSNRFGTAAAVADQLWEGLARDQAIVLANLEVEIGWALALAASPISVRLGAPQLGVRTSALPPETEAFLTDAGFTDPGVFALGDVTVIDEEVVAQVTAGG